MSNLRIRFERLIVWGMSLIGELNFKSNSNFGLSLSSCYRCLGPVTLARGAPMVPAIGDPLPSPPPKQRRHPLKQRRPADGGEEHHQEVEGDERQHDAFALGGEARGGRGLGQRPHAFFVQEHGPLRARGCGARGRPPDLRRRGWMDHVARRAARVRPSRLI